MKYIYRLFLMMLVTNVFVACSEEDLDINTSPNNPATSTPQFTLPVAQVEIAQRMSGSYNVLGSVLSQYWTQGPTASQYSFLETYTITTTTYTGAWQDMYAGALKDLDFVRVAALEEENNNMVAIAMLLQAYSFQVLVDLYDQIPYFESLQGKDGITQPLFDDGATVYADLIVKIDEALNLINANAIAPGTEDLIYGGDMTLWTKFANTLKLRIFMRQSEVNSGTASAGIQAMVSSGAEFLASGEDAQVNFSASTQNENPLWQELNQTTFQNLVASLTSTDILENAADPRLGVFYDVAPNNGQFTGLLHGVGTTIQNTVYDDFGHLSATNIVANTTPVIFMSGEESLFLQAEAAARGYTSGSAQSLYDQAVLSSFAKWGLDGTGFVGAAGVYEYPNGTEDQNVEAIIMQKWTAFNGTQGLEAWNDIRRTGFPSSLNPSATSSLGPGLVPLRLVFPSTEVSSNSNVPALVSITTPVWWDVN